MNHLKPGPSSVLLPCLGVHHPLFPSILLSSLKIYPCTAGPLGTALITVPDWKTFEVKCKCGTGSECSCKCYNVPCLGIMCGKWLVLQTLLQISNPVKGSWVHLIKDYMWLVVCKVKSTTCIINEYSHINAALSRDWTRWPLRPIPTRMIFWLSHLCYANRYFLYKKIC